MFQSNTKSDQACDNEGTTLGVGVRAAGFLVTTSTTCNTGKYGRLWRRSLWVGILISLKKGPYAPLPQEPPAASENFSRTSSARSQHVIEMIEITSQINEADKIAQIVKEKDLKSLQEVGGVDEVQKRLSSDGDRDGHVWNTNSNPVDEKGFMHFFLKACSSFTIFLLLASAGLSFAIDTMQEGGKGGWHDGVAILVAVVFLVAFPSVGNFHRERKMVKQLLKHMNRLEVNVERSEQTPHQRVAISDVVLGDKVLLEKDDHVPADGLLVNGKDLELDEVFNSKIDRDKNPFLFSGSKVIEGRGRMLVTAVGADTTLGKALSLVTHEPNEKSLLEARIEKPNGYIDKLALCVTVLIALVVLIRLLCKKHSDNVDSTELKGEVSIDMLMKIFKRISLKSQGKIWILTSTLTAIVIGIQHGISFVIAISLYHWKEKVEEKEAELQNPSACSTMGLVTVICIDATGGHLMCNQVEITNFYIGEKDINNDVLSETDQSVREALCQGIIGASVHAPEIYSGPTNHLLKSWAKERCGFNMEDLHQNYDILKSTKLSCVKKGAGVLMRKKDDGEQFLHLHWNGAASTILDMCSHYYDSSYGSHAMEGQKRKFEQVIKDMEEKGLRTIAFAYRQTKDQDLREDGLNLLALVGLKYSCQEEFKQLVEALKHAGVSIKLVSEDELSAVKAIAHEVEIFKPGSNHVALKGVEIQERMEDEVNLATVVGSLLPEDKLRMIKCLKGKGHIVAFFGGMTASDTLTLKEADVGITDNTRSTELAGKSSDIIVKDFGSLVPVLKFGRCGYNNIQKFTQLQYTACISGLLITLVTTMITGESPITGIELIWLNLVMCLLGGLMMVMELKSQELLTKQLGNRTQSLITKVMWGNIAIQVLYQASILLIFQFKGQTIPSMNDDVRKTMTFNTFILCQIFNQFNVMDIFQIEVLRVVLQSYCFLAALVAVMIVQVMVTEFFGSIANYVRLNAVQWALCFLVAALSWGFGWALKVLPLFLTNWSVGTHYGFSNRMPRPYVSVSSFGIPFFMFLFFSVSYYLNPGALPGLFASANQFENAPRPA